MKRQEMAFDPFQLIDKKDRKQLTRRGDWMGLAYLVGHFTAIGAGVGVVYLTYGTILMLPAMLAHGVVLACLFAPMHECSHGTAFRTRALNEAAYWLVSLVYISQPTWYRYRHAVHHTYTQIQGKDPAMVLPGPTTWQHYFEQLLGWRFWTTFPVAITKHALGRMRKQDSVRAEERSSRIYNEARIMIACYAGVASVAIWFGSFAPLVYWLLPRMMGEPLQRAWRIAEHKGCDEGTDVRTNTRSTKAGPLMRALCWNMPYHPSTMSFRRRRSSRCLRSTSSSARSSSPWAKACGRWTRKCGRPASCRPRRRRASSPAAISPRKSSTRNGYARSTDGSLAIHVKAENGQPGWMSSRNNCSRRQGRGLRGRRRRAAVGRQLPVAVYRAEGNSTPRRTSARTSSPSCRTAWWSTASSSARFTRAASTCATARRSARRSWLV